MVSREHLSSIPLAREPGNCLIKAVELSGSFVFTLPFPEMFVCTSVSECVTEKIKGFASTNYYKNLPLGDMEFQL